MHLYWSFLKRKSGTLIKSVNTEVVTQDHWMQAITNYNTKNFLLNVNNNKGLKFIFLFFCSNSRRPFHHKGLGKYACLTRREVVKYDYSVLIDLTYNIPRDHRSLIEFYANTLTSIGQVSIDDQ